MPIEQEHNSADDPVITLFHELCEAPADRWEAAIAARGLSAEQSDELLTLLEHGASTDAVFLDDVTTAFPMPTAPDSMRIDEYRVIRRIGAGGMGIVYLAEDPGLGRHVAIKVLPSMFTSRPESVQRFRNEAQALGMLDHPAIVPVHRFARWNDTYYIASAYIEGETLADRIERQREQGQPDDRWISEAIETCRTIALALHYAHQQGVIHRDVKPSNILLGAESGAHLCDFGIARVATDASLTRTLEAPGTAAYMPPEQAGHLGSAADARSDVYALGAVLLECLTLKPPRPAPSQRPPEHEQQRRIETGDRARRAALVAICTRALAWDPAARHQSAGEFAADLDRVLAGLPISAGRLSPRRRVLMQARAHPVLTTILLAVLTIAVLIPVVVSYAQPSTLVPVRIAGPRGAAITAQQYDIATQKYLPPVRLGETGIRTRLAPGQYRFTVRTQDGVGSYTRELRLDEPIALDAGIIPTSAATADMILIPGGRAIVGMPMDLTNRFNQRTTELDAFWIDRHEVTNAQYRAYTQATGAPPAPLWETPYNPLDDPNPVSGLRYGEARAYAEWAGKRLPTMWEWERAARGTEGWAYPWGNDFDPEDCGNVGVPGNSSWSIDFANPDIRASVRASLLPAAVPLGRDVTPEGVLHCYGNVAEITDSPYPADDQSIAGSGESNITKGRPWSSDVHNNHTLSGLILSPFDGRTSGVGFRCARSADEAPGSD